MSVTKVGSGPVGRVGRDLRWGAKLTGGILLKLMVAGTAIAGASGAISGALDARAAKRRLEQSTRVVPQPEAEMCALKLVNGAKKLVCALQIRGDFRNHLPKVSIPNSGITEVSIIRQSDNEAVVSFDISRAKPGSLLVYIEGKDKPVEIKVRRK